MILEYNRILLIILKATMIPLVYYDTSILQSLIDNPNAWNNYHDWSKKELGSVVEPLQSFYVFCEYYGFNKSNLAIPSNFHKPDLSKIKFPPRGATKKREEKIPFLLQELIILKQAIESHIRNILYANKDRIKSLIVERGIRKERQHNIWRTLYGNANVFFSDSDYLEELLFQKIIDLFDNDFDEFAKYLASLLAWDELCSIAPDGISQDDIKELLIGFWRSQYQDHGVILPLARPAIGLTHFYKIEKQPKNYYLQNYKDAADSEMYTKLVLGQQVENDIRPVNIITLETIEIARARMRVVAANIVNIEDTLKTTLPKFLGKIYCVNEKLKLIDSFPSEILIKLPDLEVQP